MRRWLRDDQFVKRRKRTGRDLVLECVLEIRADALELLRSRGEMRAIDGVPGRIQSYECGSVSFMHTTPFQQLHILPPEMLAEIALLEQATGRKMSRNLEYGLDIWSDHRKVFNLQWSIGDREIHLVSFKRGVWQEKLRAEMDRMDASGQ